MDERFKSFDEFWPHYVKQHALPQTRIVHFFGTTIALTLFFVSFFFGSFKLFLVSIVAAYVPAWISHLTVEKNRPATFDHPGYSILADMKMFYLMLIGKMDEQAEIITNLDV